MGLIFFANSQGVVFIVGLLFQNGRLKHSDVETVWDPSKYPKDLHSWLLRLTEEFDLTFPLKDEDPHLVPCLLSDREEEV